MKELKLPVIKTSASNAKILSMDEYLEFVKFNIREAFDKKAYAKWKKMLIVNTRFAIRRKGKCQSPLRGQRQNKYD